MAKSLLDERDIVCSLADENANLYGGAPLAMPVRLLVNEEQADEARSILKEFQDSQLAAKGPDVTSMNDESDDIGGELKVLRSKIENNTALVVLLMVGLGMFGLYECSLPTPPSRQAQVDSWNSAHAAMDNFQYEKAADIAHRLINKNPNYYYGYTFLGYLALERNQLEEAEKNFARAYELFPTPDHRDKLEAVRKRLAAESRD